MIKAVFSYSPIFFTEYIDYVDLDEGSDLCYDAIQRPGQKTVSQLPKIFERTNPEQCQVLIGIYNAFSCKEIVMDTF